MTENSRNDFRIFIEYGKGFYEFITDGKMPGNRAKVKFEDEFLVGGEDYYTESPIMGITLVEALQAVEEINDGNEAALDFPDGGGTILVIEPKDEQTVTLTTVYSDEAVTNPDERIFDPTPVSKDAVISEIIRVAKEWRDEALTTNSDIDQVDWFQKLEVAIEEAESTYQNRSN